MDWAENAARMGSKIRAYRILVGRPDGKRTRGIYRHTREDNIEMYRQEVGWLVIYKDFFLVVVLFDT